MNSIRFHYIELDGPVPFAASLSGQTLHVMINAKAALEQDVWVREYLADWVTEMALEPPKAEQQMAQVIDMTAYLYRGLCGSTPSKATADRQQ